MIGGQRNFWIGVVDRRRAARNELTWRFLFRAAIIEGRTETTFHRDTAYHTEVVGRMMPPGRTVPSQKTIIDARHVGKCPAGMKAGDMALPNGLQLNVLDVRSVLAKK